MNRTGVLVAIAVTAAACAGPQAGPTTTTTAPQPTTTTTAATTTTSLPPIDADGWVTFGPDGLRHSEGEVLRAEGAVGWETVARDGDGGLAFVDEDGLWWRPRGADTDRFVAKAEGDLVEVVPTLDGPVARIGACPSRYVRLADGVAVGGSPQGKVEFSCGTGSVQWRAANGLFARITGPGVTTDDEGQIVGIEDVAQLVIRRGGETVLSTPVGGFYEAYARIHDFDGRYVIVSRGPFEPAMPDETYFVIDLETGETRFPPVMAATSATLLGQDVEPVPALMAPRHIHMGSPLLTDDRIAHLEDGRYVGYVTHVAHEGLTGGPEIHLDLTVWFSGKEAEYAAMEDSEESPNDYYIRNVDPLELVLSVHDTVEVTSVWYHYDEGDGDLESLPISWAEFVEAMTGEPVGSRQNMWFDPWWVTITDGEITAIDEQYVP